MQAWAARRRGEIGIGVQVEAAIAAQAHEDCDGKVVTLSQVQGPLNRIVARTKDKQRDSVSGLRLGEQPSDLFGSQRIDVLTRDEPLHLGGCSPAVAGEAALRDPLIRPPGANGLARRNVATDGV
jgi:hypothetical protein